MAAAREDQAERYGQAAEFGGFGNARDGEAGLHRALAEEGVVDEEVVVAADCAVVIEVAVDPPAAPAEEAGVDLEVVVTGDFAVEVGVAEEGVLDEDVIDSDGFAVEGAGCFIAARAVRTSPSIVMP